MTTAPWSAPRRPQKPSTRPAPRDGLIVYIRPGENPRYPTGAVCLDAPALKRALRISEDATLRWALAALFISGWLDAESDRPERWVVPKPGMPRERMYVIVGHQAPSNVKATFCELRHTCKYRAGTGRHRDGSVVDLPEYPGSGGLAFPITYFS